MVSVLVYLMGLGNPSYFLAFATIDTFFGICLVMASAPIAGFVLFLSALLNIAVILEDSYLLYQHYETLSATIAPLLVFGLIFRPSVGGLPQRPA